MTVRAILRYPNPRLRIKAEPVESVDDEVKVLVKDMLETMYADNGIGLAATQIDVHRRIFVADISEARDRPMCFINPEITGKSGSRKSEEGCLSVPGIYAKVDRAESIVIQALNENGESFSLDAEDLLAICCQHELDHLNGVLFVDYLSPLKQKFVKKKLEKLRRETY